MSGAAARECAGSFSSVSSNNTASREVEEEFLQHQQRQFHIKPLLGSPPEMGTDDGDLQRVTGPSEPPPAAPTVKKKRSLPGTPDPSAEVIALSPRTLMATNRFVCEICHKGFQRDQNLQLHRRGHNLPWKLRQRGGGADAAGGGPPRKRVYVCPEASCVHHNPGRALGDLTGIKKHYCRKHGEKKWKCERCAKRYAVHSDWKAHAKVCGTREYKCDCGTVFSRRDSFVTHRAFCDALAQENNKLAQPMNMATVASALQGQAHRLAFPQSHQEADDLDAAEDEDADDFALDTRSPQIRMLPAAMPDAAAAPLLPPLSMAGCMLSSLAAARPAPSPSTAFFTGARIGLDGPSDPNRSMGGGFSPAGSATASMSATALLQKAAEMGATTGGGYGAGFATVGFGPMLGGPNHVPTMSLFGPLKAPTMDPPYDGLTLGPAQLVGLDAGRLLPGQLYYGSNGGGAHGSGVGSMTRAIGSLMHGGQQQQTTEHRRPDDLRVVDYLGVDDQRSFSGGGVSPFGPHIGPWA
ncbi:protein indeterminate-domain 2-like [Panicum miliaceum]|uniref:Protein EARLY HEADING DATE 2 n=1 Tax=Panicum miliaceum TaxID=4540 RepID=A0A3L6PNZ1_PANMI|nr:protein indeterminate-domain 2-like [Panicum miliaceum]